MVLIEQRVKPAPTEASGTPLRPEEADLTVTTFAFPQICADEVLLRSWDTLEATASLPTQSRAFVSAMSTTLASQDEIEILTVRDHREVVGMLTLAGKKGAFARRQLIGSEELGEPGDALCSDPHVARLLADAIAQYPRALQMARLPAGSLLIPALRAALAGKAFLRDGSARPTPTIKLDASWKDPASRFNSGRRSDFRRAERKASQLGRVSFEILSPARPEFDRLFDEAVAVEARSWKGEAGTALAIDTGRERFFRIFFRSAAELGQFRVAFMRIDGRAVAMQMGLECLDRFWLFKIGFDEEYGRCSPGTLLMLHTIGWAADRGLRGYELLGSAEPWISELWTREEHEYVGLSIYPFNVRGAVAFAADFVGWLRNRLVRAQS